MNKLTHVVTDTLNNEISRYTKVDGSGIGYVVTINADGKQSRYHFHDSFELALEYRESVHDLFDRWSAATMRAEMVEGEPTEFNAWLLADMVWEDYIKACHHARYERWGVDMAEVERLYQAARVALKPLADGLSELGTMSDPWAFRRYVDDAQENEPYMAGHDRNGY